MICTPNKGTLGSLKLPPMNKAHKSMVAKGAKMAPALAKDAEKAFKKGDFASAVVLFNAANNLSPHPIYSYNVGRSYHRIAILASKKGPENIARSAAANALKVYALASNHAKLSKDDVMASKAAGRIKEVKELLAKLGPAKATKDTDKDSSMVQAGFPVGIAVGAGMLAIFLWLRNRGSDQ